MKKLLFFLLFTTIGLSCTEKIGIDDIEPLSQEGVSMFKSQKVVFHDQSYDISYQLQPDSTFVFEDSKSENNYQLISSVLDGRDDSGIMYSLIDTTMYIFESKKAREEFMEKRYGGPGREGNSRALQVDPENEREAIEPFENDSVEVTTKFVSFEDEIVYYTFSGVLGEFKTETVSEEDSDNGRRINWRPKVPGSKIRLWSSSNYGGTSYDVLSGTEPYEEYYGYLVNLPSSINNQASSIQFTNESTRTMIVELFEDSNAGGGSFTVEIGPRNGATYYGFQMPNLADVNMNAICSIFCKKANDRISSVGFRWEKQLHLNPILSVTTNCVESAEIPAQPLYTSITKNISDWNWNACASSSDYIGANYTGCFEFQVDSETTNLMFGFSYTQNNGCAWETIDFAIYQAYAHGNTLRLYNAGTYLYSYPTPYVYGDVITVCRQGSYVNFYHNSSYVGRISANLGSALYLDMSIATPNAVVRRVDFGYW